jgi:hypothetical protein
VKGAETVEMIIIRKTLNNHAVNFILGPPPPEGTNVMEPLKLKERG